MPNDNDQTDRGELDELGRLRAARGDARAWRRLVSLYQRRVFALADRLLSPRGLDHLVEDVAQETFLDVHRQLARFRPEGGARLSTWILTIASRRCVDAMRRHQRRVRRDEQAPAPALSLAPDATTMGRRLAALVGQLPPEQHAVFVLRVFHEFAYGEIAEALDLPEGTVKSRLARARADLEAALKESP